MAGTEVLFCLFCCFSYIVVSLMAGVICALMRPGILEFVWSFEFVTAFYSKTKYLFFEHFVNIRKIPISSLFVDK